MQGERIRENEEMNRMLRSWLRKREWGGRREEERVRREERGRESEEGGERKREWDEKFTKTCALRANQQRENKQITDTMRKNEREWRKGQNVERVRRGSVEGLREEERVRRGWEREREGEGVNEEEREWDEKFTETGALRERARCEVG
jgi:hypothetical protein